MATKKTKAAPIADESDVDLVSSIFLRALKAIDTEIQGLISGTIKPKGHDKASRIAWLVKNVASVAAEQRKAEKAELDSVRRITPGVVMQWIKLQTPEYRARLVREVQALDAKERKSVLG